MNKPIIIQPHKHSLRVGSIRAAATTGLLVAGALVSSATPSAASPSLCPEFINGYYSQVGLGQVPGDLDLCTWSSGVPRGQYADVLPTELVHYTSCAAFKDAHDAWEKAGRPPASAPAPKGHTAIQWHMEVTNSVRLKDGSFQVELGFLESLVTPATITLYRPTWPNMNGAQIARIDDYMQKILLHEQGHQNLDGKVAAKYTQTFKVPKKTAKNEQEAGTYVYKTFGPAHEAAFTASTDAVDFTYDALTDHGRTQGALGGSDYLAAPTCPQATLVSADQKVDVLAHLQCSATILGATTESRKTATEKMTYQPPPIFYEATLQSHDEPCASPPTDVTAEIPGILPVSGESRSLSEQVIVDSSYPTQFGQRNQHADVSASVSTKYVDEDGRLTLSGSVACSETYSQTGDYTGSGNALLSNYTFVNLRFQVDSIMPLKVLISGQPATEDFRQLRTIRIVDRLAAEYFTTGTVFEKTLFPGVTYEIHLADDCTKNAGNYDYSVTIES